MWESGYQKFQLWVWPTRWAEASGRLHKKLDIFSYFNKKWQISTQKEIPLDACKTPVVGSEILPWALQASVSQLPLEVKGHCPFWFLNLQDCLSAASRQCVSNWNIKHIFSLVVSLIYILHCFSWLCKRLFTLKQLYIFIEGNNKQTKCAEILCIPFFFSVSFF